MKAIALFPFLAITGFFGGEPIAVNHPLPVGDSTVINHTLDGMVKEWPISRFVTDDKTGNQYAIDNDGKNIYLVMNIPDSRMQFKMMRNGMSTYIDLKAKKKEGQGIEFPEKNESNDAALMAMQKPKQQQEGEPARKPDIKAMRKLMAMNLVALRLFGFSKGESLDQQLMMPNSVNIAFAWDSTDVMHLEYRIPLSLLGEMASLNKKEISIGWEIHAFEIKKDASAEDASMNNAYGGGRMGYGGGQRGGYYGGDRTIDAQRYWTKYVIEIPDDKKAF